VFVDCKCGHNAKGTKYCDLGGGDDEWVEAFDAFNKYIERSQDCHASEGFGSCKNNQFFKPFKCAEIKAKLYVDLIDLPSCIKDILHVHPFFYEYSNYCFSLMGLCFQWMMLLVLLLVLVLA
jgi:hypothetical protein